MRILTMLILLVCVGACKNKDSNISSNEPELTAQEIIDRSIAVAGGEGYNNASITFEFRDLVYDARRKSGNFTLKRIQTKNGDSIVDVLNNEGFYRFINNQLQSIADSTRQKFSASVNSVHYFSILPYGLNDPAVKKRLLGEELIKGESYFKVEITFDAQGGGEDYEDVFVYWIHQLDFKPHYLAYSYEEEDGFGLRFREAYNERYIKGLRFVDYRNYKPSSSSVQLTQLAKEFELSRLQPVSTIELTDIEVSSLYPE